MNQQQPQNGAWVRLHMEHQNPSSSMPESIVGFLSEETPGSYVLTKSLRYQEDEDTYEMVPVEIPQMLLVSRTYVWACEILGEKPTNPSEGYSGHGGLG